MLGVPAPVTVQMAVLPAPTRIVLLSEPLAASMLLLVPMYTSLLPVNSVVGATSGPKASTLLHVVHALSVTAPNTALLLQAPWHCCNELYPIDVL